MATTIIGEYYTGLVKAEAGVVRIRRLGLVGHDATWPHFRYTQTSSGPESARDLLQDYREV